MIFGVPFFARECAKVAERYGVNVHYQHNLVAVDAKAKTATFEIVGGDNQGQRISVPYDMLHVLPPQSPPDDISSSPLANGAGWVEVNQNSMQHVRHANVFALGDVTTTPNSKIAAAVRKQAPVVVRNILRLMNGQSIDGGYDGYASCPLTSSAALSCGLPLRNAHATSPPVRTATLSCTVSCGNICFQKSALWLSTMMIGMSPALSISSRSSSSSVSGASLSVMGGLFSAKNFWLSATRLS